MRMSRAELAEALARVGMVLVPAEVSVTVNGRALSPREPAREFDARLPTEVAGEDGSMRRTERRAHVRLVRPHPGETPHLYELGVPVAELPGRWHLDVAQKVPQGMERDSVSPAYVRRVMTAALAAAHDLLEPDDAREEWVGEALATGSLPEQALDRILTGRFGARRVSADPSDPEGTKLAVSHGYEVVPSGAFTRRQWEVLRAAGAIKPAGQVTPSPKPYSQDPNAPVRRALPAEQITDGMQATAAFINRLAPRLLGDRVSVEVVFIADRDVPAVATFGPAGARRCLFEFNVAHLGTRFFELPPGRPELLELAIHEFGHWFSGDHLAQAYHRALCRLGAKLTRLALEEPSLFGGAAVIAEAV